MEVETCENLRNVTPGKGLGAAAGGGGHYGFAEKVVDGITVNVNSVILVLKSKVFTASFQVGKRGHENPVWTFGV